MRQCLPCVARRVSTQAFFFLLNTSTQRRSYKFKRINQQIFEIDKITVGASRWIEPHGSWHTQELDQPINKKKSCFRVYYWKMTLTICCSFLLASVSIFPSTDWTAYSFEILAPPLAPPLMGISLKVIGCSSVKEEDDELDNLKTLRFQSIYTKF